MKHRSVAVVGDALETVQELDQALGDWRAAPSLMKHAKALFADWNKLLDEAQTPTNAPVPTYAQVIAAVNRHAKANDTLIAAAGGLPGEVTKNWRIKDPNTFDCEFGYSCMGYEIAAGWGHAMAKAGEGAPIVMVGDGSYMMLNSDIYSSVLSGHKMIVVVCDNGGFAVINRLQNAKGVPSFDNLDQGRPGREAVLGGLRQAREFMGALARRVESVGDLESAMEWAQTTDRTTIIAIATDAFAWVPGDADWDVGVPEVSERESVRKARAEQEEIRRKQRVGV